MLETRIADTGFYRNKNMDASIYAAGRRRTEITIETRSVTIIRTRAGSIDLVDCPQCGREVRRLTEAQSTVVFGVDADELRRLTVADNIHFVDETDLCGLSLVGHFGSDIKFIED